MTKRHTGHHTPDPLLRDLQVPDHFLPQRQDLLLLELLHGALLHGAVP